MYQASNPLNGAVPGNLVALRFGPFELDVRSGEMKRHGSSVRIQPQPFKVLVLLASRPGDVVTREEIQAEVWPAGTFVDFEQSLNFCIRQIRAALSDNALAPRYVETLPRRGYRWVGGPVERVTSGARLREWPRPLSADPARAAEGAPAKEPAEEPAELPALDALAETPARGLPAPVLPQPLASTATARARRYVSIPVAVAAIALAVALGAVLARLSVRPAAAPEPPTFQRLTFRRGSVNSARFAPDGQVVFTAAWDGLPSRVFVTRSDPRDFRAIDITDAWIVGVSSSGEVAFQRGSVLSRAPLAGGPPKDVLKGVIAADWTADGEFAVARVLDDKVQVEFPIGRPLGPAVRTSRLRVSPDGRHVALTQHPQPDDDRGGVVVFDRSGRRVAESDGWGSVDGLAWNGGAVWFTAARVGADSSLHALSLDGRVRTVLSGMGRLVLHDVGSDGRLLLERANLRAEMLLAREGQAELAELSWLDFSAATAISADGSSVLFYESGQGGGPDYTTFVRRTDGSLPVRVGTGRAVGLSPDGQWMLSIPLREPARVDVVPVGPGEPRQVKIAGAAVHEMAGFVGDGRTIFVSTRDEGRKRSAWLVGADGSNPRRLPLPENRPLFVNTFSPDGTRFLASCPDTGAGTCVYRVDGGTPQPVKGAQPSWRPTGWDDRGRLYFRDRAKHMPETLWRLDPASGRSSALVELVPRDRAGAQAVLGVVVSRDGATWAFNVLRRLSDLHVVTDVH
jgi:DNA-binding winged helix-turn-helix (wHTH) protein